MKPNHLAEKVDLDLCDSQNTFYLGFLLPNYSKSVEFDESIRS